MSRDVVARPDFVVTNFHGMVTASPQMLTFFETLERVARTDSTVLIRGETGTGKELVAKALHNLGPRAERPFAPINCATLTGELLASELFGHVRGAFTGAIKDHAGLFAVADTGTVFLDEIAEIPPDIQARLLRVLQERTFTPVGGTQPIKVDVRVLSATHRSLRDQVEQGRFREDLMYRVRVVPLYLPRLVERTGDVEALLWQLIDHFNESGFRRLVYVERRALDAMLAYTWPGNVRELRNVVEYAFAIGEGDVLRLEELPPELRGEPPVDAKRPPATAEALERARILEALRASGGRKSEAAAKLGMSRSTLWRKLKEHRI
jgi:two-component system response regulator AtoC